MNPGGEAADQLVKIYLSGAEMLIRLSGSLLKNLLALSMALAKENKKVSGKINLAKMLRETRDLRTFTMTPAQYKAFKKLAKKQGILFAAVTDKDDRGKLVDVILPATELDRANLLFERILYDPSLGPDSPEPPRHEKKHWWQRLFHREARAEQVPRQEPAPLLLTEGRERERENPTRPVPVALPAHSEERSLVFPAERPEPVPLTPTVIPLAVPVPEMEPQVVEAAFRMEEVLPEGELRSEMRGPLTGPPRESGTARPEPVRNDAPPSRQDLPDTSGKSPILNRDGDTRTTRTVNERPSVLKRLAAYRAQLDSKDAPAKEKGKETPEKPSKGGKRVADRSTAKPKSQAKGGKRLPKPVR